MERVIYITHYVDYSSEEERTIVRAHSTFAKAHAHCQACPGDVTVVEATVDGGATDREAYYQVYSAVSQS
jgi:hypothetical protein